MYAVIKTGGKQYKVAEGQRLEVELVAGAGEDLAEVSFSPLLLVDGGSVTAAPADLSAAKVTARVVGRTLGPKITAGTYKNKSNQSRRWGHRQRYSTIEITGIRKG